MITELGHLASGTLDEYGRALAVLTEYGLGISSLTQVVPGAPVATTLLPGTVGTVTAQLKGALIDMGSAPTVAVSFEYGPTTSYGSESPPVTKSAEGAVSTFVASLAPDTVYHVRTKAVGNGTSYGADIQLQTNPPGPSGGGSAPILVEIGGVLVPNVEESSIRIESILGRTTGTAKMRLYDKNANLPVNELADVVIYRNDTGDRLFGGLASIPTGSTEGRSRWWDLNCQQYTTLLETTLVFNSYASGFTYDGLTGDKAIIAHLFEKSIVGQGGGDAAASEINARMYVQQALPSMAAMFFFYTSLMEAMVTISNYAGWNFRVDHYKRLHYYLRESAPAPFNLSSSPDGVTSVGYHNLKWKRDGTYVRNAYLMFGANLFSSPQEYILPNSGSKLVLTLGINDIDVNVALAAPPGYRTIRVFKNTGTDLIPVWTELSVGVDYLDTAPPKDVLHSPIGQTLRFATAPPNFTNSVKVIGLIPFTGGQPDSDEASITKYGRLFFKRMVASDANSVQALQAKLAAYKKQFAFAVEVCTLTVDDSDFPVGSLGRFEVGQYVYLTNTILGLINKGYVVQRVTTTIIGGELRKYDLELRSWFTEVIT